MDIELIKSISNCPNIIRCCAERRTDCSKHLAGNEGVSRLNCYHLLVISSNYKKEGNAIKAQEVQGVIMKRGNVALSLPI